MKTYKEWAPTRHDTKGLAKGLDGVPGNWLVCPVILTRDSKCYEVSNYHTLKTQLAKCAESSYQEHCFGHWACGWFQILIVRPGSVAATQAMLAESKLEDYPYLDEDDVTSREFAAVQDLWERMSTRERIQACVRHGSIFVARRGLIPERLAEQWIADGI